MRKPIYSIENKMTGYHESDINGMIDIWSDLLVTKDQFKSTIFEQGVPYAQQHQLKFWIVDTSNAANVFHKDVQAYIESTVAPGFAAIGITHFFLVLPKSALSRMSAKNISRINDSQEGMQTVHVGSVDEAVKLIQGMNPSAATG